MVRYGIVVSIAILWSRVSKIFATERGCYNYLVYDPENAEVVAEELGGKGGFRLDELVASSEVDCVVVATPNYLHKEPVIKVENGKMGFL